MEKKNRLHVLFLHTHVLHRINILEDVFLFKIFIPSYCRCLGVILGILIFLKHVYVQIDRLRLLCIGFLSCANCHAQRFFLTLVLVLEE